jgi:hypothetical protein
MTGEKRAQASGLARMTGRLPHGEGRQASNISAGPYTTYPAEIRQRAIPRR